MASLLFPLQFERQYSGPLDQDQVFLTTAARLAYLTSALRYAGQIVSDVETGKAYQLNAAKDTWVEIGGAGGTGSSELTAITTFISSNSANWGLVTISDPLKFNFTANGSTKNFTVSGTNGSTNASYIDVYIENVKQEPEFSYTLSADTVKFIEFPESGSEIVVITPNTKFVNLENNTYNIPTFVGGTGTSSPLIPDPVRFVFTGNGSTTDFAVSGTNNSTNPMYVEVFIDNVRQISNSIYTLSSEVVKFVTPPDTGSTVVIVTPNYKTTSLTSETLLSADSWNTAASLISFGGGNQVTNVAVGLSALKSNTTGNFNTALGYNTLTNSTTGTYNIGIGAESLKNNTIGRDNTSIGAYSLRNNINGDYNVGIGSNSLYTNTSGYNNVSIGAASMYGNTSGYGNIAIGRDALYSNTTGIENMAQGYRALFNSNSNWNVAVGTFALYNLTTGERNVAVGKDAAINNITGEGLVAIGDRSAAASTNRSNITAVGRQALFQITGSENTAIGAFSQCNFLSPNASNGAASKNTSVGYSSLGYVTSGSNNVAIGHTTLLNNLTGNNNTAIGYEALNATDYTNTAGVGYQAAVTGDNQIQLGNSSTTTYVYNTVQSRSDLRDKTDIRESVLGLNFINKLRPVDFKWDYRDAYKPTAPIQPLENASEEEKLQYKKDLQEWANSCKLTNIQRDGTKKRNRYHHGLIAQEVKEILETENIDFGGFQDHKINGGEDVYTIGYIELIAPLIKSVQELTLKLTEAQAEITELKTEIYNLKK